MSNNTDRKRDIDDIYRMLDSIASSSDSSSLDDVRRRVNIRTGDDRLINYRTVEAEATRVIRKPELPKNVDNYETRLECFLMFLQGVDYSRVGSQEYIDGHRKALENYYVGAQNNPKDLAVIEGQVKEELSSLSSGNSLYSKGYYEGLNYVARALKRSKELLTARICQLLKKELG